MEFITGQINVSTRESTLEAKWKATVIISIPMAPSILGSTSETRGKGLEFTEKPTLALTPEHGYTASNMDSD